MEMLSRLLDIQIQRDLIWNINLVLCGILIVFKAMRPNEIIWGMTVHRDKIRKASSNVAKISRKWKVPLGHELVSNP